MLLPTPHSISFFLSAASTTSGGVGLVGPKVTLTIASAEKGRRTKGDSQFRLSRNSRFPIFAGKSTRNRRHSFSSQKAPFFTVNRARIASLCSRSLSRVLDAVMFTNPFCPSCPHFAPSLKTCERICITPLNYFSNTMPINYLRKLQRWPFNTISGQLF